MEKAPLHGRYRAHHQVAADAPTLSTKVRNSLQGKPLSLIKDEALTSRQEERGILSLLLITLKGRVNTLRPE